MKYSGYNQANTEAASSWTEGLTSVYFQSYSFQRESGMPSKPSYDALVQKVAALEKRIRELQQVENAFQRSSDEEIQRRFEKIFSLSQDFIAYVDGDYTFRMVNDQFCRDQGKTNDETIGRQVAEIVGEKLFQQTIKTHLDRCLSGEIVHYQGWFEYPLVGRRYRNITYFPDRLADGPVIGVFVIIQDSTAMKLEQEGKKTKQALLSHILASIPGEIYLITDDYDILYVNPHMEKSHGPVNGRKCFTYIFGRQTHCPWCKSTELFAGDKPIHWLYESETDGKVYDVFENVIKNPEFPSVKVKISFLHDITKSIGTELELHSRTQLLNAIINNSTAIIYVKDCNGNYMLANQQFTKIFKPKQMAIKGKTDLDLFPRRNAIQSQENDKAVLTANQVMTFEEKLSTEGHEHDYLSIKFPICDEHGVPYGVGGITTDITERKQMEQALLDQNEQMLSLINATPDFICFKDGGGRWLQANEAGLKLFRLEGLDYLGKTDAQLAEYSEFYRKAFLAFQKTDEISWKEKISSRGLEKIPQPDGGIKTYDLIKIPLFHSDGQRKGLVVIGRDITEDIRASDELQKKNKEIHDTNIALRVLLEQQKGSQEQLEQLVMENLKRFVFPYMKLLGHTKLEEDGQEYMNLINAHLYSLMDAFCRKLDDPSIGLTPKELLVADMVRKGKSSADIAQLLNLTIRTVDVYRNIIRKKLKISGKKINLHAYLQKKFP